MLCKYNYESKHICGEQREGGGEGGMNKNKIKKAKEKMGREKYEGVGKEERIGNQ